MGKQITRRAYKGWNREVSVAPGARESEQLDLGVSDHSVHRRQVGRTGLPRFTHEKAKALDVWRKEHSESGG